MPATNTTPAPILDVTDPSRTDDPATTYNEQTVYHIESIPELTGTTTSAWDRELVLYRDVQVSTAPLRLHSQGNRLVRFHRNVAGYRDCDVALCARYVRQRWRGFHLMAIRASGQV